MHSPHFENKDSLTHVMEKKAEGSLSFAESHGLELPVHLSSGADAARDTALAFLLLATALTLFSIPSSLSLGILLAFCCGWLVWKGGRSAWLGWSRLERLHRTVEQEKYEIEHNREQEREELTALYRSKGLEGQLLEDVIAVLMADQDRLLKIMLEEELGISLHAYEHPLKQCLGASIGVLIASATCFSGFALHPFYGTLIASLTLVGVGGIVSARYEKNALIPAAIWLLSLGMLAFGVLYFVIKMMNFS